MVPIMVNGPQASIAIDYRVVDAATARRKPIGS
jgi:hypothetical protein